MKEIVKPKTLNIKFSFIPLKHISENVPAIPQYCHKMSNSGIGTNFPCTELCWHKFCMGWTLIFHSTTLNSVIQNMQLGLNDETIFVLGFSIHSLN